MGVEKSAKRIREKQAVIQVLRYVIIEIGPA
jgi:hypothetical protein